jgi:hypothetical protein
VKINQLLLFIFLSVAAFSQEKNIYLDISFIDSSSVKFLKNKSYRQYFSDSLGAIHETIKIVKTLHDKGYLAASFDSISLDSNKIRANLFVGPQFKWEKISYSNDNEITLKKQIINLKHFKNREIDINKLLKAQSRILNYYEKKCLSIYIHTT